MHDLLPCEGPVKSFFNSIQSPLGVLCIASNVVLCQAYLTLFFVFALILSS